MPRPILIIHGWSDTSDSFKPLAKYVRETTGRPVEDIFLGDYLSMQDEITLPDLGTAMIHALERKGIPTARHSFDVIVHSTGGLVAREFLLQFCRTPDGAPDASMTPIRNLLMLAPANFGSPLAKMGKSMVGRLFKGWKWDGPFETGKRVLEALELASPYSWDLAMRDLFDPAFPIFDPANTCVTVMVGSNAYSSKMKQVIHENGSDGTVRVSTANLNAYAWQLSLEDPLAPALTPLPRNCPELALAVFDRDHGSITRDNQNQRDEWRQTLSDALNVDEAGYAAFVQRCNTVTAATYAAGMQSGKRNKERFHQYLHSVFHVHDQYGDSIEDYFLEFYQEENDDNDTVFEKIHKEVLEKVTCNSRDASYRSLLFDLTDLQKMAEQQNDLEVCMSLVAADLSKDIGYRNPPNDPRGGIPVFRQDLQSFFLPNCPVLIDVKLIREQSERVFDIKRLRA